MRCIWLGRPPNERNVTVQTWGCSGPAAPSGVMVSHVEEGTPGPVWRRGTTPGAWAGRASVTAVRAQGPPGACCVTLGKFFNLSVPSLPHL